MDPRFTGQIPGGARVERRGLSVASGRICEADCRYLDPVHAIVAEALEEPWNRQEVAYFLAHANRDCRVIELAEGGGEPQVRALCLGLLVAGQLEIASIVTETSYRRCGLALQLLESYASDFRIERMVLEVRTTNEGALALYERFGFIRGRRRYRYYRDGSDAWEMHWDRVQSTYGE